MMKDSKRKEKKFVFPKVLTLVSFVFISISFYSCDTDDGVITPTSPTPIEVRMTDAPGDFEEVNIDLQQIRVQTENQGWIDLATNQGIYNLLDFANGLDTIIALDSISATRINQIRFVLGSNNSVVVDGQSHSLKVPSGEQSGLKLLVNKDLTPGIRYSILIDFDAARSIVLKGNGSYSLKPVLKVITEGQDAILKGAVTPATPFVKFYAMQGPDTLGGAFSDSTGSFIMAGLLAGNYSLVIVPPSPYLTDTVNNISLVKGSVTDLGSISLKN